MDYEEVADRVAVSGWVHCCGHAWSLVLNLILGVWGGWLETIYVDLH